MTVVHTYFYIAREFICSNDGKEESQLDPTITFCLLINPI